jgi:hypothetical protein
MQVAPTILQLLDLDPNDLDAVQKEGTRVLPGLFNQNGNGQGQNQQITIMRMPLETHGLGLNVRSKEAALNLYCHGIGNPTQKATLRRRLAETVGLVQECHA